MNVIINIIIIIAIIIIILIIFDITPTLPSLFLPSPPLYNYHWLSLLLWTHAPQRCRPPITSPSTGESLFVRGVHAAVTRLLARKRCCDRLSRSSFYYFIISLNSVCHFQCQGNRWGTNRWVSGGGLGRWSTFQATCNFKHVDTFCLFMNNGTDSDIHCS